MAGSAAVVVSTKDVLVVDRQAKNLVCERCGLSSGRNSTFRRDKLDRHLAEHKLRGHAVAA